MLSQTLISIGSNPGIFKRDVGSDMRSKRSGISSATRIRSIQQGLGPTEQPWLVSGKQRGETRRCMIINQSSLA
ncbi:hypothetical protein Goari_006100 [Gossypium aridum]|uniref:Uncharacterized protein n=1 Tax=Gossypium aridum TaxID=34290 RepID=A0A7J8XMJ2_GOSAI|nr:hypothetical protein [Gossypium aridum]